MRIKIYFKFAILIKSPAAICSFIIIICCFITVIALGQCAVPLLSFYCIGMCFFAYRVSYIEAVAQFKDTWARFASKRYWVFLKAPLQNGDNKISLNLDLPGSKLKVSVWAWAKKPGNTSTNSYPNTLPQPEDISLESVNLVDSFTTESFYAR